MFAFSSAKVHFFFEICKRKMIFSTKFPYFLPISDIPGERKRCRRRGMAAGQIGLMKGWESL